MAKTSTLLPKLINCVKQPLKSTEQQPLNLLLPLAVVLAPGQPNILVRIPPDLVMMKFSSMIQLGEMELANQCRLFPTP